MKSRSLLTPSRLVPGSLREAALRYARPAVHALLRRLEEGVVTVVDDEGSATFGRRSAAFDHKCHVHVDDPTMYLDVALGGSIGVGEAYMLGKWTSDDLPTLCRIFARNAAALDGMERGWARLGAPLQALHHRLRRNTREGSRRNIAAHYDLGNDFFALFLDETMMYSAAVFERPGASLFEAQLAKLDRICRKLALGPADHLLEIGTGWGGLAIHAARNYGCRVTTTTISREQRDLALRRVRDAGLDGRVRVLLEDYRDLEGRYDKLVSIEMVEAVGREFLGDFFEKCASLLAPEGVMLLQAITIGDQGYERYARSSDFIKRYIFPGSCLLSIATLSDAVARRTDLRMTHLEDLTQDYARTLHLWRERFLGRADAARRFGYSEDFIRMWDFYLAYCEGGFRERYIGDVQAVFAKPKARPAPILPPLEAERASTPLL